MSQNLIGYLFFGPKTIDPANIPNAVAVATRHLQAAKDLLDGRIEEYPDGLTTEIQAPPDIYAERHGTFPATAEDAARKIVDAFVRFWEKGGADDSITRDIPGLLLYQALAAGDCTDGGTPQGEGYQILDRALELGFLSALEIR